MSRFILERRQDPQAEYLDYLNRYRIKLSRVYVAGLSMGGYVTYSYIGKYGDSSYAAADTRPDDAGCLAPRRND